MDAARPLEGIRIADLTHFWSGPFATGLIGAMGAEVIKTESIQHMDMLRLANRPPGDTASWETGPVWAGTSVNKLGCTLDLTRSQGRDLFLELVSVSDAVVENYSSRVLSNLSLEYPELRRVNPAMVLISMPPFGKEGSWKDNVGFAYTFEAMSGAVDATGYPDAPLPTHLGAACDPVVGYMAAFAIVSALLHARTTGEGQYVELSQLDAFTVVHGQRLADYTVTGDPPQRWGNCHRLMAPHNCYPCRGEDRYITIAVRSDEEWRRLIACMGNPAWALAPALSTVKGRRTHCVDVDKHIGEWTESHEAWELARRLQAAGIAATPVQGSLDLTSDRHMLEREFYQTLQRDIVGTHDYPWYGFKLSGMENRHLRPPPLLGEHNIQVIQDLLGVTQEQYERLIEGNIAGYAPAM